MSFAWPWIFLALPLPWLWRRLAPAAAGAALRVPQLPAIGQPAAIRSASLPLWIASVGWLLLVTAAARPQDSAERALQPAGGHDLILAFDVSASMATADLRMGGTSVPRLDAARALAGNFLKRRQGDRVGLIVFGSQAYLHTPLTHDLGAVRAALAAMEAGFAGRETALGDAIGLATRHLTPLADHARVLVLLTDGANTAGALAPERAAWLAQRAGVRVHAIGMAAASDSGAQGAEDALQKIAEQTGGRYLRWTDSVAIERFLPAMDTSTPRGAASAGPPRELYPWPLAVALALGAWLGLRRTGETA